MTVPELATACLLAAGGVFFLGGTVGLLRFPDAHSRLHAVTKADNLGLGLVVFGLVLQVDSPALAVKLLVIWLLVLLSSGTAAYLMGTEALARRESPTDSPGNAQPRA